ncbi:hypothetical protein Leryth_025738 [Lithospermum erythrorhizon]|nr:hypothetical protein Leryth_025738 [Lithospermum erythrorhizon]
MQGLPSIQTPHLIASTKLPPSFSRRVISSSSSSSSSSKMEFAKPTLLAQHRPRVRVGYGTVRADASNISYGSGGYEEKQDNDNQNSTDNKPLKPEKPLNQIPYPLSVSLVLCGCGLVYSVIAFTKSGPSSLLDAISKSGFTAAFSLIFVSEIGDKTLKLI